ncbi:MAG: cob(I)yrinic acid a,c-diamide adenosyltransferase [Candidatus Aureabacteria bacterium]|nr:cob(I)yrinic acid a,c-diamide adenosyltransferase [Candidatus Auribacterota bacterium]
MKTKKQSVVTKKGDKGYTFSYAGIKMSKDDLRLETVGTMDELSSFLGMAKNLVEDTKGKKILEKIQNDLFIAGSRVFQAGSRNPEKKALFQPIAFLENEIKNIEKQFTVKGFVLPGDSLVSSVLHVARTVARRLERRVLTLKRKKKLKDDNIIVYLNRLSDLIFLLACLYVSEGFHNQGGGKNEKKGGKDSWKNWTERQ